MVPRSGITSQIATANPRIKNEMVPGVEGGISKHDPSGDVAPIYTVAMRYKEEGIPTILLGGKEYGTGSWRDWAAKGTPQLWQGSIFETVGITSVAATGSRGP
jgi:aconitase A